MSVKALTWCWDAAEAGLIDSSGAVHVLAVLSDHGADHAGEDWTCFPSVKRIMRRTRLSQSAVERHLKWLIAERWISRAPRPGRSRDDEDNGLFTYTLHRSRADEPLGKSPTDEARSVGDLPTGDGTDLSAIWEPPVGNSEPTCRQFDGPPTPPNKADPSGNRQGTKQERERAGASAVALAAAGSPDFEGLPGDAQRRAAAERLEAAYAGLAAAWVAALPGRVDDDKARLALSAAEAAGEDAALIGACAARFLADAKASRDRPMLHNWLAGKRWRGFEPKAALGGGAPKPAAPSPFDGPAELMAALSPQHDWPRYLAGCDWDAAAREVTCRTIEQARELRTWAGGDRGLAELNITVTVRRAAA